MTVYLDASVIVPLFVTDVFTARIRAFLNANTPALVISDFAATEFASVIACRVRTRDLTGREAQLAFSTFDVWSARSSQRVETVAADMVAAAAFMRRLDLRAFSRRLEMPVGRPRFNVMAGPCAGHLSRQSAGTGGRDGARP